VDGIEDRDPGAGSGRHDGGSLPEAEAERVSVDPVFPDVKEGRRAGMLVLSLAGRTSPESVAKVLDALRGRRRRVRRARGLAKGRRGEPPSLLTDGYRAVGRARSFTRSAYGSSAGQRGEGRVWYQ